MPEPQQSKKRDTLAKLVELTGNTRAIVTGLTVLVAGIVTLFKVLGPDDPPTAQPPGNAQSGTGSGGEEGTRGGDGGGARVLRVVQTTVRVDPFFGMVDCPAELRFSGRITAVGGSGDVTYRWARSDGASAPAQTVHFDRPGSRDVHTTWTRGGPGDRMLGWQAIEVLEPSGVDPSARANFDLTCNP